VITPEAQMDERAIQTFLREATILRQLQHPNIVKLLELGSSGQRLYLATEYVEAEDWTKLTENCSTEKRIQLACGLMSQILGALEYAHSRSFVHRDVKPGNVLITRNGGKLTAKLADLGLAKQYTTAGMSQVTRDGDVIGSLPFISPDQFLNSREARPTCDIYSAGATLYWMLSGHEPILLDDHPCKFLAILENPPVPLEKHLPQIPVALAQLVHRTLEKTPERRFASAAEMRRHLREFARP
jgi:serine/threonine protein kinase